MDKGADVAPINVTDVYLEVLNGFQIVSKSEEAYFPSQKAIIFGPLA